MSILYIFDLSFTTTSMRNQLPLFKDWLNIVLQLKPLKSCPYVTPYRVQFTQLPGLQIKTYYMPMNYGWPNTPQGIKLFHVAHQKDAIFKTTFLTVLGQNLGRDPTAYYAKFIKEIYLIHENFSLPKLSKK